MATTKIAVVLRDDLAGWQALNVTAFLTSGLAAGQPELIGQPYEDADGTKYLPLFGQPRAGLRGRDELDLVGIGLCGPRNTVDRIVKGARLHR